MKIKYPTELQEGIELAKWLDSNGYLYTHIPNGENREKITGYKLRLSGVKPGVPDYLIFHPVPNGYHGIALELKRQKGGKLSDTQEQWLLALNQCGWCCIVAYGAMDAIVKLLEVAK